MSNQFHFSSPLSIWRPPTLKYRSKSPTGQRPVAAKLTKTKLQKEQRHANKGEHDDVWDEESAASITVTQVREPTIVQIL